MASREHTVHDHRKRLNRVLVYIQNNIEKSVNLETLAAIAHFSPFHFHRIFAAFVGETLYDHIRRVRLEKAAQKLHYSDLPVTEVALSAGYKTPAAFTKAFKKQFGKTPTRYKTIKQRSMLLSRPDVISKRSRAKAPTFLKPEIRMVPTQKVLFVRKTGPYRKAAAQAWGLLMNFAYSHRIMDKDTKGIGISHDSPEITPEEKIRYDACITFKENIKPEGEIGVQDIAGGRYAVFLHKGPYSGFNRTYDYIMAQWYPASGEKFRDLPCFEVYLNRDPERTKPENLRTEIHVPIE